MGVISLGGKEKTLSSDCVAACDRASLRSKIELLTGLVQSCGLERLVDIASLASDSFGNLSGAHSFLPQRHDACAIESGGAAFVNPLRLRGVDAGDPAPEFSWGGGGGSFRLAARRKR